MPDINIHTFVGKLVKDMGVKQVQYSDICINLIRTVAQQFEALNVGNKTRSSITETVPIDMLQDKYHLTDTELYKFVIIPSDITRFNGIYSTIYALNEDIRNQCYDKKNNTIHNIMSEIIKAATISKWYKPKKHNEVSHDLADPYYTTTRAWTAIARYFSVNILLIDTSQLTSLVYDNMTYSQPDPKNPLIIIYENSRGVYSPVKVNEEYMISYSSSDVARKVIDHHTTP